MRLKWLVVHKKWTLDLWHKILWTIESKFETFGSRRLLLVRRQIGTTESEQCLVPTVKHNGNNTFT